MRNKKSIVDVLVERAKSHPEKIAFRCLTRNGAVEKNITYSELHLWARRIGYQLMQSGHAGDCVIILMPTSLEYIAAFFGCLYAGRIAVPLYPPRKKDKSLRIKAVTESCNANIALSFGETFQDLTEYIAETKSLPAGQLIDIDTIGTQAIDEPCLLEEIAFLQYTSGSTGDPKGVMISHRNIIENSQALRNSAGCHEGDIFVNWLPLFHDLGLITAAMLPVYIGAESVLIPPVDFIKEPKCWLESISKYRGTIGGAPNFAFDLCTYKIHDETASQLDLSSWRIAYNAAEPIRADTLKLFHNKFKSCGFKFESFFPAYGMAEATVFIAGGSAGKGSVIHPFNQDELHNLKAVAVDDNDSQENTCYLISCGGVAAQHEIRIVDPQSLKPLSEGHIGEIWFHGASVGAGYWGRPQHSEEIFRARIYGEEHGKTYLRTGDLGFVKNSEIFISGRIKDMIIVNGLNYFPQDIEVAVQTAATPVAPFGMCAAFSITEHNQENLVIVLELRLRQMAENMPEKLKKVISQAIAEEFGLELHSLVLTHFGSVPKTSSGKVQRSRCKQLYLNDELDAFIESKSNQESTAPEFPFIIDLSRIRELSRQDRERDLTILVLGELSRLFGKRVEKHRLEDSILSLGLDSLKAMQLQSELESKLNIELPIHELMDNVSIKELVNVINEKLQSKSVAPEFQRVSRSELSAINKLSHGQQSLWALQTMDPGNVAYSIAKAMRISSTLDVMALQRSVDMLLMRHDMLRSCFVEKNGAPERCILNNRFITVNTINVNGISDNELRDVLEQKAREPFNLATDPLLRISIYSMADEEHILFMNIHHIICDFKSLEILIAELGDLYHGFVSSVDVALPEQICTYQEFANWRDQVSGEASVYWKNQFNEDIPILTIPTDFERPNVQRFAGDVIVNEIDAELYQQLTVLSQKLGVTLYCLLFTCYQVLLNRFSGQERIIIGTPVLGRTEKAFYNLIGYCVNSLPIATTMNAATRFDNLVKSNYQTLLAAFKHQNYPLECIVRDLDIERDPSRAPLFQTMFVMQHSAQGNSDIAQLIYGDGDSNINIGKSLQARPFFIKESGAQFDLTMELTVSDGRLKTAVKYNTALFEKTTGERILNSYHQLLRSVVRNPNDEAYLLQVADAGELEKVLNKWNSTEKEFPDQIGIHQLFEQQAIRTPDSCAVAYEGTQLTYRELEEKTAKLASVLVDAGVKPDTLVGVFCERSIEMIVGIMAILRAGGAYVPFDPDYPADRLAYLLKDSSVGIVLVQSHIAALLPVDGQKCLVLDDPLLYDVPATLLSVSRNQVRATDLAYMIYTSGTTGNPKGVMIEHRALVNRLVWMRDQFAINEDSIILQKTPYSFDVSVWELLLPFISGSKLVFAKPGGHKDGEYLSRIIDQEKITALHFVPSMLAAVLPELRLDSSSSLKQVFCSGEALPIGLQNKFFEKAAAHIELHNLYGPTEAAIDVSWWQCRRNSNFANVPIGQPINNIKLYILNEKLTPVSVNCIGELFIGGIGLARGYYGREDLTQEKFIPNPFVEGERLYKTGDLARWLPGTDEAQGQVDFLGRMDQQIKLRGFRIELGEIESTLLELPQVSNAVVLLREQQQRKYIAAYFVPAEPLIDSQKKLCVDQVQMALSQKLPEYMLPSILVALDHMPLTINGKLDRKALPHIELKSSQNYMAARTESERKLVDVWAEVLDVPAAEVGIHDSFFSLGGDSIKAIKLVTQAKHHNIFITVFDVFTHKTISELVKEKINVATRELPVVPAFSLVSPEWQLDERLSDAYPLTRMQRGMVFFSQMEKNCSVYHDVFSYTLRAVWDEKAFKNALQAVVNNHPVLRTSFQMDVEPPIQLVHKNVSATFSVFNIKSSEKSEQQNQINIWRTKERRRDFDWQQPGLFRIAVWLLDDEHFEYILSFHHSILDGWSVATLNSELFARYLKSDIPFPINVNEYTSLLRGFNANEQKILQCRHMKAHWQSYLEGASSFAIPGQQTATHSGHGCKILESKQFALYSEALEVLAKRIGVPIQHVLLALHIKVLSFISGQQDITSLIVCNGRPEEKGGESVLGLFLNSLPIRVDCDEVSWISLIEKVSAEASNVLKYRHYPLSEVQAATGIHFSEILFNYNHFHAYHEILDGSGLGVVATDIYEESNFKLYVNFQKSVLNGEIQLQLIYPEGVFFPGAIQKVMDYYGAAAKSLLTNPNDIHNNADLLDAAQLTTLERWQGEIFKGNNNFCVHELFEQKVRECETQTAIIYDGEPVSYGELNSRANRLAHALLARGVKPDSLVGVCLERSTQMLVALLAVSKAGGAYVPLDPDYPKERVDYMIATSSMPLLITESAFLNIFNIEKKNTICLDSPETQALLAVQQVNDISRSENFLTLNSLSYVIYTSGSTGQPKGVMIEHHSLANFLLSMQKEPGLCAKDTLLAVTPISFDIHTLELFLPLISGATLVLASSAQRTSGVELARLLDQYRITVMQATPATWKILMLEGWKPAIAFKALCGGEALGESLREELLARENIELWNMYGPTETTVWSSVKRINESVVIGGPITNTRFFVLDANMKRVPIGVSGELYIGGDGLARGYLDKPELTNEKFVRNPFVAGELLYKTGDMVRYRDTGDIDFISRMDDQVKIRGYRIELGDVEAALCKLTGVEDAAAVAVGEAGQKQLIGYLVKKEEATAMGASQFEQELKKSLPHYMVPNAFVELSEIPLTPAGKVNRKLLTQMAKGNLIQDQYVEPRNALEQTLCSIWMDLLEHKQVGVHNNFFTLGGHSLLAVRFANTIRKQLGVELPIATLFEHPTIAELAVLIPKSESIVHLTDLSRNQDRNNIPLSYSQQRLWMLDKLNGSSAEYNLSGGFLLEGPLNIAAVKHALAGLVDRHEILRTTYRDDDGEVKAIVRETNAIPLREVSLSHLTGDLLRAAIKEHLLDEAASPFELAHDLMLKVQLMSLSANEHILQITMHHIAADGRSIGIVVEEFCELYNSYVQNRSSMLNSLVHQYADYAHWQRQWLQGEMLTKERKYWENALSGAPEVHSLPLDNIRPSRQTFKGASHTRILRSETKHVIENFCRSSDVTLFMFLQSAFALLVSRYSGEDDVVIGSPIAGRVHHDIEKLIGFFANSLVIRTKVLENSSFHEFLAMNKQAILAAYQHQNLPFEMLVDLINPTRSLSFSPIFQIFFTLLEDETSHVNLTGLKVTDLDIDSTFVKFDLELTVIQKRDQLVLKWVYNADLFQSRTIACMADNFQTLLDSILAKPQADIHSLKLLDDSQYQQLTQVWNETRIEYSTDALIHNLFEQQATKKYDATALVFKNNYISYGELNRRANQLAHMLMARSLPPDTLIGVCMERSIEMMVAILAVLKAGCAYIPLDPDYPKSRIAYILADSNVPLVLTTTLTDKSLFTDTSDTKDTLRYELIEIDCETARAALTECGSHNPSPQKLGLNSNHLAYVIYTSGSTGNPKGVMNQHGNLLNFLVGMTRTIDMKAGRWLAATSLSFDISILELLCTLATGFEVIIAPEQRRKIVDSFQHSNKDIDFSLFYFASDEGDSGQNKYQLLLEGAKFADQNDFEAVWTPERHFGEFGGLYPNPVVTSSMIAAVTKNVKVRAGSCVLPLHSPIRVAEDWAVVDNISNGRVGVAFASGWQPNDFVIAPQNYAERHKILNDDIDTVQRLWYGDPVRKTNAVGEPIDIYTKPRPIQEKLPVWLTIGGNPKAFINAGEKGLNILTHMLGQTQEELAEKIALYRQAWSSAGHQGEGRVTLMLHSFVADNEAYAIEKVKVPFKNYLRQSLSLLQGTSLTEGIKMDELSRESIETILEAAFNRYYQTDALFGTPQSCLRTVDKLKGIGVNEIACLIDFGVSTEDVINNFRHLNRLRQLSKATRNEDRGEDFSIGKLLTRHDVTHFQCTPSLLSSILVDEENYQGLSKLQQLLLGGEALPLSVIEQYRNAVGKAGEKTAIINMYGPTETTIWSTTYYLSSMEKRVSIGKPIANTQVYVVDKWLNPVPVGVVGELLVAGDGVSKGYLNREELTKEKFIANPYLENGSLIYRTGDLVCWEFDGNLRYIGRLDSQVKVRGFRIELGEIESQINNLEFVKDCAAIVVTDKQGDKTIVAYVVAQRDGASQTLHLQIKDALRNKLPDFMVPGLFVSLKEMPLTPNGKINRKALPAPDFSSTESAIYCEAKTNTEKILAGIWEQLLGVEQIGIHDNFFDLGGHSITGTRLIGMVRKTFQIELPLRLLFENPTIAGLAHAVEHANSEFLLPPIEKLSFDTPVVASFSQQRLWLIDSLNNGSVEYNKQGGFQLEGKLDLDAFRCALGTIIDRHEVLRTMFEENFGEPRLRILESYDLPLFEHDLTGLSAIEQTERLAELVAQDANQVFELSRDIKLRMTLVTLSESEFVVVFNMHHIASDAWSLPIFINEFKELYTAFSQQLDHSLEPVTIQYSDYAYWQRRWLTNDLVEQQLNYWRSRLKGIPAVHSLPLDMPRPHQQAYDGQSYFNDICADLHSDIKLLCRKQDVTLFMLLQASYSVLLSYYSKTDDIVIGTPISGRVHKDIEPLIGFFVNTLVMRTQTSHLASVSKLLANVKQNTLDAYAHQHIPFDMLVDKLNPTRSTSYNPIFQLWFVLQNYSKNEYSLPHLTLKPISMASNTSLFELALDITELETSLSLNWTFNSNLFSIGSIEKMADDYIYILATICENQEMLLSDIYRQLAEREMQRIKNNKQKLKTKRARHRNEGVAIIPEEIS